MSTSLAEQPLSLFDIPGCKFTPTELKITRRLSFDHWQRLGDSLRRAGSGIQWWLGDWMNYGEQAYGEKYSQAVSISDDTGISIDTLRNYQWVSQHVPVVMRITTLPWSYHQAVAALDSESQGEWLTQAANEGWTYRELKREVDKAERAKTFKLVSAVLDKIWERIQDGCYTPEAVMKCGECGKNIFDLDAEQIKLYMQQLVGSGKAEWRKQGGKTEVGRGESTTLCVPVGLPAGSDYRAYRPNVEYEDNQDL